MLLLEQTNDWRDRPKLKELNMGLISVFPCADNRGFFMHLNITELGLAPKNLSMCLLLYFQSPKKTSSRKKCQNSLYSERTEVGASRGLQREALPALVYDLLNLCRIFPRRLPFFSCGRTNLQTINSWSLARKLPKIQVRVKHLYL